MRQPYRCPNCEGQGKIRRTTHCGTAVTTLDVTCPSCNGTGIVWSPEDSVQPWQPWAPINPWTYPPVTWDESTKVYTAPNTDQTLILGAKQQALGTNVLCERGGLQFCAVN